MCLEEDDNNDNTVDDFFAEIDADGDGYITGIELLKWVKKMNVEHDFGTVAAIVKYFDSDGDGLITLDEMREKVATNSLTGGMHCLPCPLRGIKVMSSESGSSPNHLSQRQKRTKDVLELLGIRRQFPREFLLI